MGYQQFFYILCIFVKTAYFTDMKYMILPFLIWTISVCCQGQSYPPTKIYMDDTIKISESIKTLVDQIAAYKSVDASAIGVAGSQSVQYKRFLHLVQKATTRELVQLTNHKSPIVRAYAFLGLGRREYKSLVEIIDSHLNDNESFTYLSGCMPTNEHINTFYLENVTQNTLFTYLKLYKKQKEKYSALLKQLRKN